ncbi:putative integral membrane protein (dedA homolog) [hydrothermal vent metagenome]|uniref:Putative integral membrane protein (DedA homolog) n=1 Tax=hydrothermal vent metagenome TaxID=652676 RepID=A0A1W1EIT3_9ZZZZ
MHEVANFILQSIGDLGYLGIFFLMFLESSFFPFPSEIVMIPAGYLAFQGEMNIYLAFLFGVVGSLAGALFNYFLAIKYGRAFLVKYGEKIYIKESTLIKLENFFISHGEISTFNGRLIPGIRQYISFPAGLAKMNIFKFSIYTSLGASIWIVVLLSIGYFIGDNQELISENLKFITMITLLGVVFLSLVYYFWNKRNS